MGNSKLTLLSNAKMTIEAFVKRIGDCAVKMQEVFDALLLSGVPKPIEVLPKYKRTVELSNGVYQTERQSYKFKVDEAFGKKVEKLVGEMRAEGKARKEAGIDQLNQQIRFVYKGTKMIVLSCRDYFNTNQWAVIFTLDNSELSSTHSVDIDEFDSVITKDKSAQHAHKLEDLTPEDLEKIQKSKVQSQNIPAGSLTADDLEDDDKF